MSKSKIPLIGAIEKPCPIAPYKWKALCLKFMTEGTSFCVNPNPAKGLTDPDISYQIERAFRAGIQKYIDKHYADLNKEDRPKYPDLRMIAIGEHSIAGKFHFHGIFKGLPNDMVHEVIRTMARRLGRTEVSMVRNWSAYIDYMFKSYIGCTYPEIFNDYDVISINIKVDDITD